MNIFKHYILLNIGAALLAPVAQAKCPHYITAQAERLKDQSFIECALISDKGGAYIVVLRDYQKRKYPLSGLTIEVYKNATNFKIGTPADFTLTQINQELERMDLHGIKAWIYTYDFAADGLDEFVFLTKKDQRLNRRYVMRFNTAQNILESLALDGTELKTRMAFIRQKNLVVANRATDSSVKKPFDLHYQNILRTPVSTQQKRGAGK